MERRAGLLLLIAAAALTLVASVAASSPRNLHDDALDSLGEPWRTGARERKEQQLKDVLSSLGQVRKAEATAAEHEKDVGSSKLEMANRETQEATQFMAKAEKLLASEQALKDEQAGVKHRLDELEHAHHNVRQWEACADGADNCRPGDRHDEWETEEEERGSDLTSEAMQKLRNLASLKKHHRHHKKKHHRKKKGKKVKEVSGPLRMRRPPRNATSFDSRPEGHPYGDYQWNDEKPAVKWSDVKRGALKAGYDLSNCFVAAAKDPSMVTVKILNKEKITIQKTWKKCTCKFPFKYYREAAGCFPCQMCLFPAT